MRTKSLISSLFLSIVFTATPILSFAEKGGSHGGGGDPEELFEQSLPKINKQYLKFQKHFDRSELVYGESDRLRARERVLGWVETSSQIFQVLKAEGKFANESFLAQMPGDEIKNRFSQAHFEISPELEMPGPNGKSRRVLFASDPATQTIRLNWPYWNETFTMVREEARGSLRSMADTKRASEFASGLSQLNVAIAGIIVHETLVLNGAERSRVYDKSKKFVWATVSYFQNPAATKIEVGNYFAARGIGGLLAKTYSVPTESPMPGEQTFSARSRILSIVNVDMDRFQEGKILLIPTSRAQSLAHAASTYLCREQRDVELQELYGQMTNTALELDRLADEVGVSNETQQRGDDLTYELSTLNSKVDLVKARCHRN